MDKVRCKKCKGAGEHRRGEKCSTCRGSGSVTLSTDADGKKVITPAVAS